MKTTCILIVLLLLPACATLNDEVDTMLRTNIGKPLSDAVLRYGPPATNMELDGRKYYGWTIDWQGMPCRWTFEVRDKTIVAVNWSGSPEACWNINYYKH